MYQLIDKNCPWIVYATGEKEYCQAVRKTLDKGTAKLVKLA